MGKCLPSKCKDLSSDLQHPSKRSVMVTPTDNPNNSEVGAETGEPGACWPASLAHLIKFQVNERAVLKQDVEGVPEKQHL